MRKQLLLWVLLMATLPMLAVAGQINTFPGWNGTDTICCLAYPSSATYGEAIATPAGGTAVTSFSFWLQQPVGFQFQTFISAWDNINHHLTGPMLYLSSVTAVTDSGLDKYTFSGLNVPVAPSTIYMFGITIDGVYDADSGLSGYQGGTLFSGGNSTFYFAWSNEPGTIASLHSDWNDTGCALSDGSCGQAAWLVDFSESGVPEPASLGLLAAGMLLLGLYRCKTA